MEYELVTEGLKPIEHHGQFFEVFGYETHGILTVSQTNFAFKVCI